MNREDTLSLNAEFAFKHWIDYLALPVVFLGVSGVLWYYSILTLLTGFLALILGLTISTTCEIEAQWDTYKEY